MSPKFKRWVREAVGANMAPNGKPIHVRLVLFKDGSWGETRQHKKRWLILVDSRLSDALAWLVFLHELAHIHSWDDKQEIDHTDCGDSTCGHWGCAYARLWRDHHHDFDHVG